MSREPMTFVTEFFWLARSRALAKRLSDADLVAFERRLKLGKQRAAAAKSLWGDGHRADGLRLAVEAFDATVGSVAPFGEAAGLAESATPDATPAEEAGDDSASDAPRTEPESADSEPDRASAAEDSPDDRVRAVLVAEGMVEPSVALVLDATRGRRDLAMPAHDEEVAPAHAQIFRRLLSAQRRVQRTIRRSLCSRDRAIALRVVRIGTPLTLAIAAAITAYVVTRVPEGVHATASDQYAPELGAPISAIDGNPTTEWLTPDAQAGWLEITINPPQRITKLRLLNGHNRQFNDRAVRRAIVQVFDDGDLARTIDQRWPQIHPEPAWIEHEIGLDEVDRIRFEVVTFHEHGGALAEIAWE